MTERKPISIRDMDAKLWGSFRAFCLMNNIPLKDGLESALKEFMENYT